MSIRFPLISAFPLINSHFQKLPLTNLRMCLPGVFENNEMIQICQQLPQNPAWLLYGYGSN